MKDDIIRKLLDTAKPEVTDSLERKTKLKLEKAEIKKEKEVQDILTLLDKARNNSDKLTSNIIRTIIETYIDLKDWSIVNNKEMPKTINILKDFYAIAPKLLNTHISYYLKGNSNEIIKEEFSKSLSIECDKTFKICFDGKPLVYYKEKEGSNLDPSLFDRELFIKNGFDFKNTPSYRSMVAELTLDKLTSFISDVLSRKSDMSKYLTDAEIIKYQRIINGYNAKEKKIADFKKRCDNNLEIILCDITKGLIENLKNHSNKTKYSITLPFLPTYQRHYGKKLEISNYGIIVFLEKVLNKKELNLFDWLNDNTNIESEICYYPHQKNGSFMFLPILLDDLKDQLEKYGWEYIISASSVGKKNKIADIIVVSVKAKDFIKLIMNEDSDNKEEQQHK